MGEKTDILVRLVSAGLAADHPGPSELQKRYSLTLDNRKKSDLPGADSRSTPSRKSNSEGRRIKLSAKLTLHSRHLSPYINGGKFCDYICARPQHSEDSDQYQRE